MLITQAEVARLLSLSLSTVKRLIRSGKLSAVASALAPW